jgi:general L-amino acid transport system permease protein
MTPTSIGRRPPPRSLRSGPVLWMRMNLFNSWLNAVLTLAAGWILWEAMSGLFVWGVRDAVFGTRPEPCQGISGACWAVVGDYWRVFLSGRYPDEERWRVYSAFLLILAMLAASFVRALRRTRWFPAWWGLTTIAVYGLVRGGVLGLKVVDTQYWGGLMITLSLSSVGLAVGIPAGVLLALGRTSRRIPVIKAICVGFIELVRSVPFIMLLIMSSIMLPMFFPKGWDMDHLLRAQVATIMSAAANSAEITRGGLAAIGKGQVEAAKAIGLNYWRMMGLVVLPQALRYMIPVFVSMFIIFIKDTSLVVVVGLFDLLGAARLAAGNPRWMGRDVESFVFVGLIYFTICFAVSRYSRRLEAKYRVKVH